MKLSDIIPNKNLLTSPSDYAINEESRTNLREGSNKMSLRQINIDIEKLEKQRDSWEDYQAMLKNAGYRSREAYSNLKIINQSLDELYRQRVEMDNNIVESDENTIPVILRFLSDDGPTPTTYSKEAFNRLDDKDKILFANTGRHVSGHTNWIADTEEARAKLKKWASEEGILEMSLTGPRTFDTWKSNPKEAEMRRLQKLSREYGLKACYAAERGDTEAERKWEEKSEACRNKLVDMGFFDRDDDEEEYYE